MSRPPQDRRVFSWTPAAMRWWNELGHLPDDQCRCPRSMSGDTKQITTTAGSEFAMAIWACWRQAVERIGTLPPRNHPHATNAMYAFRDRATRPR